MADTKHQLSLFSLCSHSQTMTAAQCNVLIFCHVGLIDTNWPMNKIYFASPSLISMALIDIVEPWLWLDHQRLRLDGCWFAVLLRLTLTGARVCVREELYGGATEQLSRGHSMVHHPTQSSYTLPFNNNLQHQQNLCTHRTRYWTW